MTAMVDVIVPVHRDFAATRRCIDSIRAHTPQRHELVLVDNGSTDGTLEYLHSLDGAKVIEKAAEVVRQRSQQPCSVTS